MNKEFDEYREKYYILVSEVSSLKAERDTLQVSINEYSKEISGANQAMLAFKSKLNKSFLDAAEELNKKHEATFENLQKELFGEMAKKDTQILELRKQLNASAEKKSLLINSSSNVGTESGNTTATRSNMNASVNLVPASISPKASNISDLGPERKVEKVSLNGTANLVPASISPKASNILDLGPERKVEQVSLNGTANLVSCSISPKASNISHLRSGTKADQMVTNVSASLVPSVEFVCPNSSKKTILNNSNISLEEIYNEYYSKHKVLIT